MRNYLFLTLKNEVFLFLELKDGSTHRFDETDRVCPHDGYYDDIDILNPDESVFFDFPLIVASEDGHGQIDIYDQAEKFVIKIKIDSKDKIKGSSEENNDLYDEISLPRFYSFNQVLKNIVNRLRYVLLEKFLEGLNKTFNL